MDGITAVHQKKLSSHDTSSSRKNPSSAEADACLLFFTLAHGDTDLPASSGRRCDAAKAAQALILESYPSAQNHSVFRIIAFPSQCPNLGRLKRHI